jgi:hypothetical protein
MLCWFCLSPWYLVAAFQIWNWGFFRRINFGQTVEIHRNKVLNLFKFFILMSDIRKVNSLALVWEDVSSNHVDVGPHFNLQSPSLSSHRVLQICRLRNPASVGTYHDSCDLRTEIKVISYIRYDEWRLLYCLKCYIFVTITTVCLKCIVFFDPGFFQTNNFRHTMQYCYMKAFLFC